MRNYIALIHKEPDSDYGVSFPDLPGCITAGTSLDDARDMAVEALALHLESFATDNEPAPEPSSLEAIMGDPVNRDGVAILVPAPLRAPKTVRINISLPEDVLEEVDSYAEANGYNRSGFLAHAAKKAITA